MCEVCDYEDAIAVADSIISMSRQIDEENTSEAAMGFADSVSEKAIGMKEWMNKSHHVTDRMRGALNNMASGAQRWLDNNNPF